jgi:hypothetical protein
MLGGAVFGVSQINAATNNAVGEMRVGGRYQSYAGAIPLKFLACSTIGCVLNH